MPKLSFFFTVLSLLSAFLLTRHLFSSKMTIDYHSMNVEELKAWLQDKPAHATLIDVREPNELEQQGVIKGYDANIPWFLTKTNPELFEKKFSAIDKEEQLVISCRSGRRSGFAAEYVVSKLGFKNVYNVKGGISDWIGHGYPVEKLLLKNKGGRDLDDHHNVE